MRFRHIAFAGVAAFTAGNTPVGPVALFSARIHKWEVTFTDLTIIPFGGYSLVAVYLAEKANVGGIVAGSDLLEGFCAFNNAQPGVDGIVSFDFGDEGMPLPRNTMQGFPITSTAYPDPFYLTMFMQNATGYGGGFKHVLEWSYDFPYDRQNKVSPIWQ